MRTEPVFLPRWMLVLFVVLMVGVAAGGAWFYLAERGEARRYAIEQLTTIARGRSSVLSSGAITCCPDAEELTGNPLLAAGVARFLGASDAESAAVLRERLEGIQRRQRFGDVILLDAQQQVRLSLSLQAD